MKTHKTKSIVIKKANVDIGMIPVVNWFNSFDSVTTLYCCQGDIGEKPYIMWTCFDSVDLVNVLSFLNYAVSTEIEFYAPSGVVRYTTRFEHNEFESFKNRISQNNV